MLSVFLVLACGVYWTLSFLGIERMRDPGVCMIGLESNVKETFFFLKKIFWFLLTKIRILWAGTHLNKRCEWIFKRGTFYCKYALNPKFRVLFLEEGLYK